MASHEDARLDGMRASVPFRLANRFPGTNEENGGFELFPEECLQNRKIMKEEG